MQMMPPGEAPEAKQFDFWIGEWEVTWDGGRGKNTIRKILDDRVIEESFDGTPSIPLVGRSFTVHNDQYGRWDQTWVDNQGSYLMFMGEWDDVDERMVLERDDMVGGKHIKQRMVFHNITPDALDWNWERSEDGGISWQPQWVIHYQRMADS
jgi:hypothetical protein